MRHATPLATNLGEVKSAAHDVDIAKNSDDLRKLESYGLSDASYFRDNTLSISISMNFSAPWPAVSQMDGRLGLALSPHPTNDFGVQSLGQRAEEGQRQKQATSPSMQHPDMPDACSRQTALIHA